MRHEAAAVASLLLACTFDASGNGTPQETLGGMETTGDGPFVSSSSGGIDPEPSTGSLASTDELTTAPAESSEATTLAADSSGGDDTGGTSSAGTTGASMPSPWCDANQADLAACYAFVDLAGGVLVDGAAAGNHGSIEGIGIEGGPLGEAAVFSADSQISVPANAATDLPSALTIEMFLRVDALPAFGRAGAIDRDGQWSIFVFDYGQLRCGSFNYTYADVPVLGEWMHVGCVMGDGYARLYIDGVLAAEVADAGPLATGSGNPLAIGDNSPGFEEPLAGAISGVRIWSAVRTATQLCEGAGDLCS